MRLKTKAKAKREAGENGYRALEKAAKNAALALCS